MTSPRLSLVTPSYNQGQFLETCMQSVLGQGLPNLEYMVLDGGSMDGSVEIIRRYTDRLAYWRSHPDGGHMDAVQEGFERSTGEIMGWLNSDDRLAPWALRTVEAVFSTFPQVEWITTRYPMMMDERGVLIRTRRMEWIERQRILPRSECPLSPGIFFRVYPAGIDFLATEPLGEGRSACGY